MPHILYFGHLVDALGSAAEDVDLPQTPTTAAGLCPALSQRGVVWYSALTGNQPLQITVNKQFAEPDTPLRNGDEVAFVAFMVG